MDSYKETFETWNTLASLYEDRFMHLDLYNHTYDFICNAITRKKAEILEIGCGPGNITKYLLTKRPDFNIFGTDIAPNMIALARKNNPAACFAVMDSRNIDALKATYDGIVGGFCLPYLSQTDSRKLIADAYQLLHENGLMYLSFVEGDPAASGFQVSAGGSSYFYFHRLNGLKEQLTESGFHEFTTFKVEYINTTGETEIHTIITARKKA